MGGGKPRVAPEPIPAPVPEPAKQKKARGGFYGVGSVASPGALTDSNSRRGQFLGY